MKTTMITGIATLVIASTAPAQQAVQWKASDGGNGHWYELILASSPTTWQDGQSYATQQGAHLATITAHTENLFLATYIQSNIVIPWGAGIDPEGCWLGGQRVGGTWTWCTSEPWMFTGWNQTQCIVGGGNQPDQDGASRLLQIACLSGGECRWDDICIESEVGSCTRPFILLEWSADCNGDGIVDYGQCHDGTLPDYDSNNTPDCCERGEPCVVDHYPVQWRVEDSGNGHWYRFVPVLTDWQAALAAARTNGADLVSITSAAEGEFLRHLGSTPTAWMGAVQALGGCEPGCEWQWSDGSAWGYQNWDPQSGEPNDGGCCWPSNEDVGEFRFGNGRWNDFLASALVPSLVEWSADCNSDGVVDYGQILRGQLADLNADGVPDICQQPTCHDADLFRDFNVNGADLGILLSQWGPSSPLTVSDINSDGVVNGADLGLLLSFWGACS